MLLTAAFDYHSNDNAHLQVPVSVPNSPGSEKYNITYSDANKNIDCGSEVISATSCMQGVCNHTFDVSNSSCSDADIQVTAFANNTFGESPHAITFAGTTIITAEWQQSS